MKVSQNDVPFVFHQSSLSVALHLIWLRSYVESIAIQRDMGGRYIK